MSKTRVCFRCGIELERGATAFQLLVQMAADFDGYIDGDRLASTDEAAFDAMDVASERSAEELAEQVYRERVFLLCPKCAERTWAAITEPGPLELR